MTKQANSQNLTGNTLKYRIKEVLGTFEPVRQVQINKAVEKATGKTAAQLSRYRNATKEHGPKVPVEVLVAYKAALYLKTVDELINL